MADAWDERLFELNSYVSRYVIKNDSGGPWTYKKVILTDIPTKYPIGWDIAVQETNYKRVPQNVLEHSVQAAGTAFVCLPPMAPGRTIYIDVYSWGDYSTPQNCPDPWINRGQQYGQAHVKGMCYAGNGIAIAGTYYDRLNLRSADNGLSWTNTGLPGPYISASDGNGDILFAQEWPGKIYHSSDYGLSYNLTNTPPYGVQIQSIIYLDFNIRLAGIGVTGYIFRSTDGGLNWTNLGAPLGREYIMDFADMGGGHIIACSGSRGHILHSSDYGATWSVSPSITGNYALYSIEYLGNGIVVAGQVNNAKIWRSTNYGHSWTDLGVQAGEYAIWDFVYVGNGVVYAGTHKKAHILKSIDHGLTWNDLGQQYGQWGIYTLAKLDNNVVCAGTGWGGLILRYDAAYDQYAPESTIKIGPT